MTGKSPIKKIARIGSDVVLYLGDCAEILPILRLQPFDAVLTDPPFGVGNFVQITGRLMGRGGNVGKAVTWNDATPPPMVFEQLRKMSWGANFFNCFEEKGGAIVWDKCQSMPNFSKADIASCTHYQKTEIYRQRWTNFTVAHQADSDHPCERPVELYEWCINYLPPCERFLDPYMGSGTVGVACMNLGRKFVGIEIDPKYFEIACDRITAAHAQLKLFPQTTKPTEVGLEVPDGQA